MQKDSFAGPALCAADWLLPLPLLLLLCAFLCCRSNGIPSIRLFVPDCCGDHSFRSPRPDSTLAFPLPLPAALVLPATTRGSGGSGGSPPLSLALALALPLALAPALAALLRSQHVKVVGKTVRVRLPRPLDTTKNIAKTTN
jgi:hypothetical protein